MLARILLQFCKGYLIKKLDSKEFKELLTLAINNGIDLPRLSEKEEGVFIKASINAVSSYLKGL